MWVEGLVTVPLGRGGAFFVVVLALLAFSCCVVGRLALPCAGRRFFCCSSVLGLSLLCYRSISVATVRGGTYFLCCCKESRQRRQLKPPAYKRVPWLGAGSGASGIRAPAHSAPVTKPSSLPLRTACVADGSARRTNGLARAAGAVGSPGDALKQPVVFEREFGARSAAGGMTALSLVRNVRGHGFQMHHYLMRTGGPA